MKKNILVTGGAGYMGSHTVKVLEEEGYGVSVYDNLICGHRESVKTPLTVGDLLEKEKVEEVFKKGKFDGVIHFAAYALAGESMETPYKYFENNIMGGLNLLEAMRKNNVKYIVFSSTCAIYGYPENLPVGEEEEKNPVSVYGESKLVFEKVLSWYDAIYNIKNVSLRYFNAAGASLDGSIGEDHDPETHIIPVAIEAALGKRDGFTIFGDDYDTPDGTNVRDYIHVLDLASAHTKAIDYLFENKKSDYFNLGVGKGYSNRQVIEMIKKIAKKDFRVEIGKRREGDPDAIYADNQKAKKVLKWTPEYSDLETIIKSAWKWHSKNPEGF